jgi:hypothetical protein
VKTTILSLVLCVAIQWVNAQHSITGIVKDSVNGSPITFATVALMKADSSVVMGTTTDEAGQFLLSNVKPEIYLMQISLIGYEKLYHNVNIPMQSDLGEILLVESANRLSEVVVSGKRPFVERRIDRYVVNVGSHIMTAGRNALDVLRYTPGVLVQPDGSVTVSGNSVEIWIDGRASNLSGDQLKALLTSTQGETIDRIEVIVNPSSRYDAAGTGGIINIRTGKGLLYGLNGSVNVGYTQSRVDVENAGLQLNYRNEALNLFGNYGVTRYKGMNIQQQTNTIEMSGKPITLDQYSQSRSQQANIPQQFRVGADFFLSSRSTLGVLVNGYSNGVEKRRQTGETHITPAYEGINYTTNQIQKTGGNSGTLANVNYLQTFRSSDQQLNIDLDYGKFNSDPSQHITNMYYNEANELTGKPEQLRHTNQQAIDVYSGKLDYTQPLGEKARMETGLKSSRSKTDNDLLYETMLGQQWETDRDRTNHFIYTEQIYAAYLNLSRSWGKWSVQTGLRGEYTIFKGEQRTTGAVNDSSYLNLFPTLYFNYRSDNYSLGISYSRRLRRPSYGQLNPFEIKTDAYTYYEGNPYLTPNYRHMIELNYSNSHNLMVNLTYNLSTDLIVSAPIMKEDDGLRYGTRPINFGKRINIGGMIYYRISLFKWWITNLMVDAAYITNRSEELSGTFKNDGLGVYLSSNNSYSFGKGISAELNGYYHKPIVGYYVTAPYGSLSAGIRKSLLDGKLMISLNVNDIFHTMIEDAVANYGRINYKTRNDQDTRNIVLSLRYNFGSSTVKASRRRSLGIEDEMGRAK